MVETTPQQRANWAPGCKHKGAAFIEAYRAKDAVFKAHGYPHNRSYTGCYACRKITGGTGLSLHAFGPGDAFTHWCGTRIPATALAEDVNASQNPYGPRLVTDRPIEMVRDMLAIRTNSGHQVWGWGGNYSRNKDGMHDELVCTPAQLATGINWATVAGQSPPVTAATPVVRPTLRRGASGAHVRHLQQRLNAHAVNDARLRGTVDGSFGPNTERRVKSFQQDTGLTQDGIVGPRTWAKLG